MNDFVVWCRSAAVAQIMLACEYEQLVRELRWRWSSSQVLPMYSPSRPALARLTKRAQPAMAEWRLATESNLRDAVGNKATPKVISAVETLLQSINSTCATLLSMPPNGPVPHYTPEAYRAATSDLPKRVRRVFGAALSTLPPSLFDLRREQERNPWLAARVIGLWMDRDSEDAALIPWLRDWCEWKQLPWQAGDVTAWKQWLAGTTRRAPFAVACYLTFLVGRLADFVPPQRAEAHLDETGGSTSHPDMTSTTHLPGPDESRLYTIKQAVAHFNIKEWPLREAIRQSKIRCKRSTEAPNAPITLRDCDIRDWIASDIGKRPRAPRNPNLNKHA